MFFRIDDAQARADIIAYLKFASTGVAKEVKVTDLH